MQAKVFEAEAIEIFKNALDSTCFAVPQSSAVAIYILMPETPMDPPHKDVPMSLTHTTQILVPLEPGLNNPHPDLPTLFPTALGGLGPGATVGADGVPKGWSNALIE